MVSRNKNIAKLRSGYLFPEISKKKNKHLEENPGAKIISLGIGDTTLPVTSHITKALADAASSLGTIEGYTGYGAEQGLPELRDKIARIIYKNRVTGQEIFVSDGAKPDVGRMQLLFGEDTLIAVQDPTYPVYVDSSVMYGKTGNYNDEKSVFDNIIYMWCGPENNFFPDLESMRVPGIIFFCSPNNPTGAAATKEQLARLVDYAKKNNSIIIYDAAYSEYILDEKLPKSIYEVPGARQVAIEVNSFSKPIGFTGVRLGWTVVPDELRFDDGSPVRNDWNRVMTTLFNGASFISQKGGLAALDDKGLEEMRNTINYYMENARILKSVFQKLGYEVHGGDNAPYIWVKVKGMSSWDAFGRLLGNVDIVTLPGAGFGKGGEGFLRLSAFGQRENIIEAAKRLEGSLK